MRVYIQIKQLGKRKCSIEKIPIDFPVPPVDVQGLIEAIVSWQVCEYNERLQQSEVLKYLTQEEVENKTASGKVGGLRNPTCSLHNPVCGLRNLVCFDFISDILILYRV